MATEVRVGGVWLNSLFEAGGIKHSTVYRRDLWSGDYQASVSWGAPSGFEAGWFVEGATFEVVEAGLVVWSGVLAEKAPSADGWSLNAYGWGSVADGFDAIEDSNYATTGTLWTPSTRPDPVIDAAIGRGWNVIRAAVSFGATSIADTDGQITDVSVLLGRATQALGKRWGVDSSRHLVLLDDPTAPTWIVSPGDAYLGTVDAEFLTAMYGYYVKTLDSVGKPETWGLVKAPTTAEADALAAKFGAVREKTVDLTALGLLSEVNASLNIKGRFKLVGGRTGWTNTLTLNSMNVRRLGFGHADQGMVRAGEMLRIPGVMDSRSQQTTRGSIDVILAEVQHDVDARTATCAPLGFVPRDFGTALAAAQTPPERVEVA